MKTSWLIKLRHQLVSHLQWTYLGYLIFSISLTCGLLGILFNGFIVWMTNDLIASLEAQNVLSHRLSPMRLEYLRSLIYGERHTLMSFVTATALAMIGGFAIFGFWFSLGLRKPARQFETAIEALYHLHDQKAFVRLSQIREFRPLAEAFNSIVAKAAMNQRAQSRHLNTLIQKIETTLQRNSLSTQDVRVLKQVQDLSKKLVA